MVEDDEDSREQEAWSKVAQGTRRVGEGEPLLMLQQGEIYMAATDSGNRPVIILSRPELNRGRWVVAVPMTSANFATRSCFRTASHSRQVNSD